MDKIISNGNQLKQRQLIVALFTAATCGAGVYLFHTPFHDWLHAAVGMSDRIADTVGSITIVLLSVIINNVISLAIFKEVSLGMRAAPQRLDQKICGDEASH
jgi:methyl-accepting chemotaxis protein